MRSRDLPVSVSWRYASPPGAAFTLHDDHVVWDAPGCRASWFAHRIELDRPPADLGPWFSRWDAYHAGKGVGRAYLCWETAPDEPFAEVPERFAPVRMVGLVHDGPRPARATPVLPLREATGTALDAVIAGLAAQSPALGQGFATYATWLYRGLEARGARTLAAWDGDRAVAAATVVPGPGGGRFQEVWTDAAWRRQGLATAILSRLLATGGPFVLQAEAEAEALRIYLRLGFRPVSRGMEVSRANE